MQHACENHPAYQCRICRKWLCYECDCEVQEPYDASPWRMGSSVCAQCGKPKVKENP